MQTLRFMGWLVDFIVGSLIWTVVIALAAPFALVGFFAWQIFYNTDRFFHLWLPFTPTAIWMMLTDPDPVGHWLLGIAGDHRLVDRPRPAPPHDSSEAAESRIQRILIRRN